MILVFVYNTNMLSTIIFFLHKDSPVAKMAVAKNGKNVLKAIMAQHREKLLAISDSHKNVSRIGEDDYGHVDYYGNDSKNSDTTDTTTNATTTTNAKPSSQTLLQPQTTDTVSVVPPPSAVLREIIFHVPTLPATTAFPSKYAFEKLYNVINDATVDLGAR